MPDDERDDESLFWEQFFERLQPIREAGQKLIDTVDASPVGDTIDFADNLLNEGSKRGHAIAQRPVSYTHLTLPTILLV